MQAAEDEFERQLEIFHSECADAVRFFYAGYGLQVSILRTPTASNGLNKAPAFWNATLDALKASTLITLGRVFDPDSRNYSLTRLIAFAHSNSQIFGAAAVRRRMQSSPRRATDIYEPTPHDFRRLKKLIATRRREYETLIRPWRHKLYAHRCVVNSTELEEVPPALEAAKLQKLVSFLPRVHGLLWRLYYDGEKPVFRSSRYSTERILDSPSRDRDLWSLQEKLVHEAKQVLRSINRSA